MYSLDLIWNQVLDIIKAKISESNFDNILITYFDDTRLVELTEEIAIITVKMKINKLILSGQTDIIRDAFKAVINKEINIDIQFENDWENYNKNQNNPFADHVNSDYGFENFVVGPNNKEAYMAALSCASNPNSLPFNPLFIYGASGLGKTHLLCAIGNYYKKNYPSKKVSYIASSSFVQEVVDAIKTNRIDQLKNELNNIDLLLVDDIQVLSGKDKTNEIFFGVYNELFNKRHQIVITSDRAPSKIKDIEERMVSRFKQGLTVTITSPEFDTACKILKLKLTQHGIDLIDVDDEAISFLATNFSKDVRALEGALTRLLFYSINFSDSNKITLKLTLEAFKDHHTAKNKKISDIDASDIINAVADYYGLTKQQLTSKTRTKNLANARHIAMYMCRNLLDISYLQIGAEFGGKDHTTVISACEKISELVKTNDSYKMIISDIKKTLYD